MISLSQSSISLYYYYNCPRYLVFSTFKKELREKYHIPDASVMRNPVTKAILEGGYDWEEKVITKHIHKKVVLGKTSKAKKIRDHVHTSSETIENLKTLSSGQYIYQGTLEPSETFLKQFGLDPNVIGFYPSRPDLIQCYEDDFSGLKNLRVIDLKASDELKITHKIQVAIYNLLL